MRIAEPSHAAQAAHGPRLTSYELRSSSNKKGRPQAPPPTAAMPRVQYRDARFPGCL